MNVISIGPTKEELKAEYKRLSRRHRYARARHQELRQCCNARSVRYWLRAMELQAEQRELAGLIGRLDRSSSGGAMQ
jgi:hypothetical protein